MQKDWIYLLNGVQGGKDFFQTEKFEETDPGTLSLKVLWSNINADKLLKIESCITPKSTTKVLKVLMESIFSSEV